VTGLPVVGVGHVVTDEDVRDLEDDECRPGSAAAPPHDPERPTVPPRLLAAGAGRSGRHGTAERIEELLGGAHHDE
jgi:hypothetical protein